MSQQMSDNVSDPVSDVSYDWKTAYLDLVPVKDIAAKMGLSYDAMRKRIERANITIGRDAVKRQVISQTITTTKQAGNGAQIDSGQSLRPMLHGLHRGLADSPLLKRKARSLRELEQQGRILNTVTQSTGKLEGWEQQVSSSVVSIELLSSVQADSFGASPALDVPAEPIDPPIPPGPADPQ